MTFGRTSIRCDRGLTETVKRTDDAFVLTTRATDGPEQCLNRKIFVYLTREQAVSLCRDLDELLGPHDQLV